MITQTVPRLSQKERTVKVDRKVIGELQKPNNNKGRVLSTIHPLIWHVTDTLPQNNSSVIASEAQICKELQPS